MYYNVVLNIVICFKYNQGYNTSIGKGIPFESELNNLQRRSLNFLYLTCITKSIFEFICCELGSLFYLITSAFKFKYPAKSCTIVYNTITYLQFLNIFLTTRYCLDKRVWVTNKIKFTAIVRAVVIKSDVRIFVFTYKLKMIL